MGHGAFRYAQRHPTTPVDGCRPGRKQALRLAERRFASRRLKPWAQGKSPHAGAGRPCPTSSAAFSFIPPVYARGAARRGRRRGTRARWRRRLSGACAPFEAWGFHGPCVSSSNPTAPETAYLDDCKERPDGRYVRWVTDALSDCFRWMERFVRWRGCGLAYVARLLWDAAQSFLEIREWAEQAPPGGSLQGLCCVGDCNGRRVRKTRWISSG